MSAKPEQNIKEAIYIIGKQTDIDDPVLIERILMECNNDIAQAILKLLGSNDKVEEPQEPTVFEQIRNILNEKDAIYQTLNKAYKTET